MENTLYTMATAFDATGNVTAWLTEPDPAIVPIVAEASAFATSSAASCSARRRPTSAARCREPGRRAFLP